MNISPDEMRKRGYDPEVIGEAENMELLREEGLSLIPLIKEAFVNIPRPKITMSVARGYDDEYVLSEERILELSLKDPEQNWGDVTIFNQEYFSFSDAGGWLFYLPAFMCHELKDFPPDWDTAYSACTSKRHMDLFNEKQMECVNKFVAFCEKYDDFSKKNFIIIPSNSVPLQVTFT